MYTEIEKKRGVVPGERSHEVFRRVSPCGDRLNDVIRSRQSAHDRLLSLYAVSIL